MYCIIRKPYNIGFSHPSRAFCIVVRNMFDISVAFVVLRRPCFIIGSQLSNPFTGVLCKSNSSSIGIEAFPSSVRVATVYKGALYLSDPCPNGWVNFTGSCYRLVYHKPKITWTYARRSCLNFNGDLLSIRNEEENLFIQKYLNDLGLNDTKSFTGLRCVTKGKWSWSDDSSLSYINKSLRLSGEEPGCALISKSSWIIKPCNKVNTSICKRKG